VLQNQFLLDATFRGDYALDTLECAHRLAALSNYELDIRDEDLACMREAALYNDFLGINYYQSRFLRAYDVPPYCTTMQRATRVPNAMP
jgi:6-phospho-beta-galactosidase